MIFLVHGHTPRFHARLRRETQQHGAGGFTRLTFNHALRPAELIAGLGEGEDFHFHACDVAEKRASGYNFAPMISLTEARSLIAEFVAPLASETAALPEAHGRVLREDILAPDDLPAFDRSAMDGYAIIADDLSPKLRVVGEVQAGQAPTLTIERGECVRIFTGAQIPVGATQVLMQENVTREDEWMIPLTRDGRTWIRRCGEDARRGDLLLAAGARLGAGELSLLAHLGATHPKVSPQPRVLHFTTGDELVDPSRTPDAGQIRDSNSILIAALVAEARGRLLTQERCGDDLRKLIAQIRAQPAEAWDLLLLSGGASVGDYDCGARVLAELGFAMHFRQINLRPGKPLIFATRGEQAAFVIPGNPVSHFVTFHLAIKLAIERLEGAPSSWPLVQAELAENLPIKPDARDTWWPARVSAETGVFRARPLAWQSSGDLRGVVSANALLPIPSGTSSFSRGSRIDALLLGGIF